MRAPAPSTRSGPSARSRRFTFPTTFGRWFDRSTTLERPRNALGVDADAAEARAITAEEARDRQPPLDDLRAAAAAHGERTVVAERIRKGEVVHAERTAAAHVAKDALVAAQAAVAKAQAALEDAQHRHARRVVARVVAARRAVPGLRSGRREAAAQASGHGARASPQGTRGGRDGTRRSTAGRAGCAHRTGGEWAAHRRSPGTEGNVRRPRRGLSRRACSRHLDRSRRDGPCTGRGGTVRGHDGSPDPEGDRTARRDLRRGVRPRGIRAAGAARRARRRGARPAAPDPGGPGQTVGGARGVGERDPTRPREAGGRARRPRAEDDRRARGRVRRPAAPRHRPLGRRARRSIGLRAHARRRRRAARGRGDTANHRKSARARRSSTPASSRPARRNCWRRSSGGSSTRPTSVSGWSTKHSADSSPARRRSSIAFPAASTRSPPTPTASCSSSTGSMRTRRVRCAAFRVAKPSRRRSRSRSRSPTGSPTSPPTARPRWNRSSSTRASAPSTPRRSTSSRARSSRSGSAERVVGIVTHVPRSRRTDAGALPRPQGRPYVHGDARGQRDVKFTVDPWDPGYGASVRERPAPRARRSRPPTSSAATTPGDRSPRRPDALPSDTTLFVDGVRRIEARAWIEGGIEPVPRLFASWAAGVVRCDDTRPSSRRSRSRRGVFAPSAALDDIPTSCGRFVAIPDHERTPRDAQHEDQHVHDRGRGACRGANTPLGLGAHRPRRSVARIDEGTPRRGRSREVTRREVPADRARPRRRRARRG